MAIILAIILTNVMASALASNENSTTVQTRNLPEIEIAKSDNAKDNLFVVEKSSQAILNKGSDNKSYIDSDI